MLIIYDYSSAATQRATVLSCIYQSFSYSRSLNLLHHSFLFGKKCFWRFVFQTSSGRFPSFCVGRHRARLAAEVARCIFNPIFPFVLICLVSSLCGACAFESSYAGSERMNNIPSEGMKSLDQQSRAVRIGGEGSQEKKLSGVKNICFTIHIWTLYSVPTKKKKSQFKQHVDTAWLCSCLSLLHLAD